MNDEVIEAELVRDEAEANAPFNVDRLLEGMDDNDLKIFAFKCAGLGVAQISERLDCSPEKVRRCIKARRGLHEWLDRTLPEGERDRIERERQRAMDDRFQRYLDLWDRVMLQVDEKLEMGDIDVLKILLKDLSQRMFGKVPTKDTLKIEATGGIELRAVPFAAASSVNRILDGE